MTRLDQLEAQGIDATGTIKSPLLVTKVASEGGPMAMVYELRRAAISRFRSMFGASTAGVLIASLLGNKQFLDRDTADLFRDGGTFHVLVISGLHITFIGGLIVLFLTGMRLGPLAQFMIGAALIWSYAIAVGAEVPVVRAALMFSLLLLGRVVFRDGNLLNLFGLCAIVILVLRPSHLFSPSFQLTFVSVGAIIGLAFPLLEKLRSIGEWRPGAAHPFPPSSSRVLIRFCEFFYWRDVLWTHDSSRNVWSANLSKASHAPRIGATLFRYMFEGVVVSLIVQIALLPLSAVYFNRIACGSVVLNLWVGVFLALESFAAIGALVAHQVSDLAALPLIALTEALNFLLLSVPRVFAWLEIGGFRSPVYSGPMALVYPVYYLPLLLLTIGVNRWNPFALVRSRVRFRRTICFVSAVLIFVVAFHPLASPGADGRLRVDFLDVGQGDSTLITFPNGETMLIDGGGRPAYRSDADGFEENSGSFAPDRATIGESVVSRFLWQRGLSKIDYLIATHADADHIQGLADVARNFSVKRVFFGRYMPDDPDFTGLLDVLNFRRIPYSGVSRGEKLSIGGVDLEVLHPERGAPSANGNDDSVVVRVVFGERSFLFAADIEASGERALLASGDDFRADVVKVAHHGSRTSSVEEFVKRTKAQFAVISVGLESPYGHPNPEIVGRWLGSGAQVLTTGESGTITFDSDGRDLRLGTFVR